MTEQDKQLLLKDLCGMLPYGVKVQWLDGTIEDISKRLFSLPAAVITNAIMFLRPMSSMTEEEKEELKELIDSEGVDEKGVYFLEGGTLEDYLSQFSYNLCNIINDWLNQHHFDYRGLIPMGLALPAKEGMYK